MAQNYIILADSKLFLPQLMPGFQLIYIDPPFNTGKMRSHGRETFQQAETGRAGFGGKRYKRTTKAASHQYNDIFASHTDYMQFLRPLLEQSKRLLDANGSIIVHLDWRESHRCKLMMDEIFGEDCFMNEIIWAFDFGGRSKRFWPRKHNVLLWYVNDPNNYIFNYDEMPRIPYLAPGLVGAEKAARGKTPTDVIWHTIVPTSGKERVNYPTQKPVGLIKILLRVHTTPDGMVLDFFAGSGTTGAAAAELGRSYVLIDSNPIAVDIMSRRLGIAPSVPKYNQLADIPPCSGNCDLVREKP